MLKIKSKTENRPQSFLRKYKITILLLIICLVLLSIIGLVYISTNELNCGYYYYLENRPSGQENTVWSSENGKILLCIDEVGRGKISFEKNGNITECYFVSDRGYFADVYSKEVFETNIETSEAHYERWAYTEVKKDTFTITVEETVFLKVGDEITFHKIQG